MSSSRAPTPSERYRQVAAIFLGVCDLKGEARRTALDRACAGDASLRARVTELLRFHDRSPGRRVGRS